MPLEKSLKLVAGKRVGLRPTTEKRWRGALKARSLDRK
jgi:hypothetical protein